MNRRASITTILFIIFFLSVFLMRLHLAVTRYIDQDEFAHLHWSWLLLEGRVPYRDFFINFTPLYHMSLAVSFLFPQGHAVIAGARLFHVLVWIGVLVLTYKIGVKVTGYHTAGLLAAAWYAIFPMNADKALEIRPDMMMTFFFLLSVYLAVAGDSQRYRPWRVYTSAFFAGLSLVVLLKIAFALPALLYLYWSRGFLTRGRILYTMMGFAMPVVLFLAYIGALQILPLAYENIVHGSSVLKEGEGAFAWWKPFAPLALVYVTDGGPSLPWVINCAFWLLGIAGTVWMLRRTREMGLFLSLFIAGNGAGLVLFPTPYLQYFMSIGTLVAVACGYFTSLLHLRLEGRAGNAIIAILLVLLGYSHTLQYQDRARKGNDSNEQVRVIGDVLRISTPGETFYDMVGSYVFRPDGYYICCNVYSTFASRLNLALPSLSDSLVGRETKFVVLDRGGKSFWLPTQPDLYFLLTNYLPSAYPKIYTLGYRFDCLNNFCIQIKADRQPVDISNQSVNIVIAERYKLTTEPAGMSVTFDGSAISDGSARAWEKGSYGFTIPAGLTSFRLQLDR